MSWFRRPRQSLSPHEQLVLYPSFASATPDGWKIVVQGCAFDSRVTWLRRAGIMGLIGKTLRVQGDGVERFRSRLRTFLHAYPAGREVEVAIGDRVVSIGPSGIAGLFRAEVLIAAEEVAACTPDQRGGVTWMTVRARSPGDSRSFDGMCQLISGEGVSLISDLDDTIKHSNVSNRRDLFHNTFARSFLAITGMADLYRECQSRGAVLHYVSASPWQLFAPILEFFQTEGFPQGSFHLKPFRLRDSARKFRMTRQTPHKLKTIAPILEAFPRRKFILVGDSGEQDAEVYAHFLRERPEQVLGVFIRAIHGEGRNRDKLMRAFAGLPDAKWHLFREGAEMREQVLELVDAGQRTPLPADEQPPGAVGLV